MKQAREPCHGITHCAICRNDLTATCIECEAAWKKGEERVCQGYTYGAVCGHPYHVECIKRWLCTRRVCPRCNDTFVFPQHLTSLKEIAAMQFYNDEAKIVELTNLVLNDSVYKALAPEVRLRKRDASNISHAKRILLARTFAHYLDKAELEWLVASKTSLWSAHNNK